MAHRPRLLITLGDVAGIGPEVLVKAWPDLTSICKPIVIGDVGMLQRAAQTTFQKPVQVERVEDAKPTPQHIPCVQATAQKLEDVVIGKVCAAAGQAAYDFLCTAIDLTVAKRADGIVTLPLNKVGLHAAGLRYPGHTEILAERTGVKEFGMMLYAPVLQSPMKGLWRHQLENPIGVIHVTLHMALRDVFKHICADAILEKIHLLHDGMSKLCDGAPRLAVAALNPHASDGGIFGNEEATIIAPAVERGKSDGINVVGPLPSDTLFVAAQQGKFDGIVAMYHDQGHIALKLLTGLAAVNVTLGLPIVRTSVAHGTAYDIAGKGGANPQSLLEAARVAAKLTSTPATI